MEVDSMADDKDKNICKHPACSCPVEKGEKYCSPTCAGAGDTMQIDCDCGHPSCTGDF
jgi:hypothetical protein